MPTFTGYQFHQPVVDLDKKEVTRQVPPTKAEIEAARAAGKTMLDVKEESLTVQLAISEALRTDLAVYDGRSNKVQPDPHEDKKYDLYQLTTRILGIGNTDDSIELKSEDITLIKDRLKKRFPGIDIYGFVYDVLEGKNTAFKVVRPTEAETQQPQA